MKVTIIGAGNMGRALATRFAAGGHDVAIVDRDPAEARRLADELSLSQARGTVSAAEAGEVEGEVVVLATYYATNKELARQLAPRLAGRVVVDISNPIDFATFEPATPSDTSAAEEVAALAGPEARVVKAFNTTFAGTLAAGSVAGQPLDVFLAGDSAEAKAAVAQLIRDGGLRPVDAGPLRRARQLEALGLLHIALQEPLNSGYSSAVKVVA